jgi:hypothetical protein
LRVTQSSEPSSWMKCYQVLLNFRPIANNLDTSNS